MSVAMCVTSQNLANMFRLRPRERKGQIFWILKVLDQNHTYIVIVTLPPPRQVTEHQPSTEPRATDRAPSLRLKPYRWNRSIKPKVKQGAQFRHLLYWRFRYFFLVQVKPLQFLPGLVPELRPFRLLERLLVRM